MHTQKGLAELANRTAAAVLSCAAHWIRFDPSPPLAAPRQLGFGFPDDYIPTKFPPMHHRSCVPCGAVLP
eukprot:7833568-Pyramimonas_sp.AAC.1